MEIVIWKRWQKQLKKIINNFKSDLKNVEVEVILVNDSPWSTIDESKLSAIKQSYKTLLIKKIVAFINQE